jgi:hypothetical protein
MNDKYPLKKYVIQYDSSRKIFVMYDVNGKLAGEDVNGRELGREAWFQGAEEVCYDYNLILDEHIPLTSSYEKFKTRNKWSL